MKSRLSVPGSSLTQLIVVGATCLQGLAAPTITIHPLDFSASVGASITNSVTASGVAPLSYQWLHNDNPLASQTNRTLLLTNIGAVDAGTYQVVVSDVMGSSTSKVARLDVDFAFTKVNIEPLLSAGKIRTAGGWVDFDSDGFDDLYVLSDGEPYLWHNDSGKGFSRVTWNQFRNASSYEASANWGDYDNDGRIDLLVTNLRDGTDLYRNLGDGAISRTTFPAGPSWSCTWVDYDRDGFLDFFIWNEGQKNFLYKGRQTGKFTQVTSNPLLNVISSIIGASWADYDNDLLPDVLLAGNDIFLFRNVDGTSFTHQTDGPIFRDNYPSFASSWGDYDNDGDLDLFVCNLSGRGDHLYGNNGDGSFTQVTNTVLTSDRLRSVSATWVDYDNDGYLDLSVAVGQNSLQKSTLFHNKGDGAFEKILTGSMVNDLGPWLICAWADHNQDGFLDLFMLHHGYGPNTFYRNNGNSNSWLRLQLTGAVSNRSALGAKVRVKSTIHGKTFWQFREISTGDGGTGLSIIAHFGLGDTRTAETVRIEWPSGIVQELNNIPANQTLRITEPVRLEIVHPNAFEFKSWPGMAFDIETSTDLRHWNTLQHVTNTTGAVRFSDRVETLGQPQSFFRVRSR